MMTEYTRQHLLQLSCENKREGLLPDCRVGVESELQDNSSWMHWQHTWQLTFWTMVRVWRSRDKAGCEWQSDGRVYTGFRYAPGMTTHTQHGFPCYIAHGLTVKLSPCRHCVAIVLWLCYDIYVGIPMQFRILLVHYVVCILPFCGICGLSSFINWGSSNTNWHITVPISSTHTHR